MFTCISLVNGVSSLYAAELRRYIPLQITKLLHISLGTIAFGLSSVCLCFGFNKDSFKQWASESNAFLITGVTATYTLIVIVLPCLNIIKKFALIVKRRI